MSKFRPPDVPAPAPLIWYARCPTLTALGLIANRGVLQREFLRENVHLVSVRENSTPSVRQGHLDHSLPNLIREADAATALWAHGQNERSRLLAIGQTYHSVSIVTRSGQPINGLRDLIGRRLSLIKEAGNFSPAQVRSMRAWETVLSVAGIPKSDIEFVPVVADHPSVPFGDVARREVDALLGGQSDVAILFGAKGLELARSAHLKEVHRFKAEEIRTDARLAGLVELRAVTVDHVLLEGREDIVTRIMGNLTEAGRWARAFPKEALKQAAIEGKVEVEDAETAYGDLLPDGARIGFEPERLTALESLSGWLKSRHLLPESHQIGQWAEPGVLLVAKENLRVVA
ncbi:ABC transporter substrate-binding protein [Asticcacaulis sp.]|uniref:ABC transporter substrate-binding protein n=1 Tax=Asticcacaulis sp. TaxID=1872648 RepID=UPI002B8EA24F|nr:ABC transporter substrate-binding protein [Asticcacaulis sp.]HTM80706.1 ABC transporter substrate-binding protein [Asticcacaulis sp.]